MTKVNPNSNNHHGVMLWLITDSFSEEKQALLFQGSEMVKVGFGGVRNYLVSLKAKQVHTQMYSNQRVLVVFTHNLYKSYSTKFVNS